MMYGGVLQCQQLARSRQRNESSNERFQPRSSFTPRPCLPNGPVCWTFRSTSYQHRISTNAPEYQMEAFPIKVHARYQTCRSQGVARRYRHGLESAELAHEFEALTNLIGGRECRRVSLFHCGIDHKCAAGFKLFWFCGCKDRYQEFHPGTAKSAHALDRLLCPN
jgi:hypothetical protein